MRPLFDEMKRFTLSSRPMRILGIMLASLGAGAVVAVAQTNAPAGRKLSLEDCIEIALRHNLDIEINRLNPELARFTLSATYGAYDPNVSISGEHDYSVSPGSVDPQGRPFGGSSRDVDIISGSISGLAPWGMTYGAGVNLGDAYGINQGGFGTPGTPFESTGGSLSAFTLRQPLLKNSWVDSTRLQIIINRKNLQISELALRLQVMNSVTAVEAAYFGVISARENIVVQQKAVELAERQLTENRKRVEVGAMAPLDEKQAESLAAQSRADLLAAIGSEQTQQRVLKDLLSDNYSEWKDTAVEPTEKLVAVPERFDLQESWKKGLTQRPDLLQQKVGLEKQVQVVRYQKNQLFPELDLFGTGGWNAGSREFSGALNQFANRDAPFWSYGAQITFPLTQRAARNNYKFAKATKEQIELQLNQLEQRVLIQIEDAIANANTSFQRVGATREARIYAEQALEAEQKKLESGKSTSFQVLQLTKDLTTARSAEIGALTQYNIDLARVAFNEGSTFERRHITLEWK
jgi:outer membrane protein TolC